MEELKKLQSRIDELQKELDELKKQEERREGKWRPGCDEEYYHISWYGEARDVYNDSQYDKQAIAIGNYFKTKEEAEFAVEKLKVMEELRQFAESEDREWGNEGTKHWVIAYNFIQEIVYSDYYYSVKVDNIYFESKEIVEKAIKAVGEERIRKYYLEVA